MPGKIQKKKKAEGHPGSRKKRTTRTSDSAAGRRRRSTNKQPTRKRAGPAVPGTNLSLAGGPGENGTLFRALADASPVGVYLLQDGNIKYVNQKAADILGYTIGEMVDRVQLRDFIPVEDLARALQTIWKRVTGQAATTYYEGKFIRKDGTRIDVEVFGSSISYRGKPAVIGTMLDVRERKKSEEQLRESEDKFRTLTESAVVGIYIYQDGVYKYVNPSAAAIMGYTVEEASGKLGPKDIVLPEYMPFLEVEIQKRLSGEVPFMQYEVKASRKDKKVIFCEVYDARIIYQGRPAIMGTFVDITARKEAEQSLQESEQKFRMLTETSLVGVYVIQDNLFRYVNPMAAQIFGYTVEEVIDTIGPAQIVQPEDMEMVEENIRKRISGEIETRHYEFRGITKDKKPCEIEIYGSRIMYHGRPAIVGSVIDVTERNRAVREKEKMQMQVFQLQKMEAIGVMTSGVAHDLNNILTVIQGHAELGILRDSGDPSIRHDLEEVLDASVKGTSLTHQLLLFGRKSPLELVPVNINTAMTSLSRMLKRLIGSDIRIVFEPSEDVWMIMADIGNIQQVIMNLIINANDAIGKTGVITVRTENSVIDENAGGEMREAHPGKYVCLTVSDTGAGIDVSIMDRIFEPFFTTKSREKGTGLGLSVVYGIAKQHNGWVSVQSTKGTGTTFRVYFPAVPDIPADAVRAPVAWQTLNGKGERILLVEDEQSMLNFVKVALGENGYTVFPASSVQEAVRIFQREGGNIDLLFSDVVLPDGNGVKLLEDLLTSKPGLRFLLTSGYADEKSRWRTIENKGYPFLQKPYTLYDLFRTIRELLAAREYSA